MDTMTAEPLSESEEDSDRASFVKEWSVMYNVTRPPDWEGANCTSTDPEIFFFDRGVGSSYAARRARSICKDCPVKLKCLDYALENHINHGIWGGMSYRERLALQRTKRWLSKTP